MRFLGRIVAGACLLAALAGCETSTLAPRETGTLPQARPSDLKPVPAPGPQASAAQEPSEDSKRLATYYARVQADLLAQGLLRTDGGGADTPFTDTMLARNFERIALAEEYVRDAGLSPSDGRLGRVKKWTKPVRVSVEFGPSVPEDQKITDRNMLVQFVNRLKRITGHDIAMTSVANANFHVLFMSEDDKDRIAPRIQALVPDVGQNTLNVFRNLPRSIHCLVVAFSEEPGGYSYGEAIAVIRTEHPDLLRRSCIHEEVAQGLGLGNDSPEARPTIFNDDDEFALLTTHDEMLLRILYNARLRAGMTADEARPIVRELAASLVGGDV